MSERQIGVVRELFRYPVKSMLGEQVNELEVGAHGVLGDRAWGIREANGRIASAKKWSNLFDFQAAYEHAQGLAAERRLSRYCCGLCSPSTRRGDSG